MMKIDDSITTLVFDIGGEILDDTDRPLLEILGCSKTRLAELQRIAFGDERWGRGVMIGQYDQKQYVRDKVAEYPELAQELEVILAPENQPRVLPLDRENVRMVKQLYEVGKYKMYWLSNMSTTEYDFLKGDGVIDMLDGGCFSCIEQMKKPQPEFYERLFAKYNLNPKECWFFDDKERNIVAGEQLGMQGTVVPSLGAFREMLEELLRRAEA